MLNQLKLTSCTDGSQQSKFEIVNCVQRREKFEGESKVIEWKGLESHVAKIESQRSLFVCLRVLNSLFLRILLFLNHATTNITSRELPDG